GNESAFEPPCNRSQRLIGEVSMETKAPFWWLLVPFQLFAARFRSLGFHPLSQVGTALATIPFLILLFPGPAACQVARGTLATTDVTQIDYSNNHGGFNVFSPYSARFVPAPRLDNTRRVTDLISDGKLMLGLDDAIALALENNLDIAVARYNLPIAQTDLLRAKGGGATRGVAGSYQSTTLFSGSLGGGVGSAGGVGAGGAGGVLGGGIDRVGSSPCCDPNLHVSYGWSNAITPLNYT